MLKTYTSESVTEGHPDKVCDQISDAILDAYLEQDPAARVAVETLATGNTIVVAGEVTSKATIDVPAIIKNTLVSIGYTDKVYGMDGSSVEIISRLHTQSPDIAQGVNTAEQGAGDQGMMYGYASDETAQLMPLPILLAHQLTQRLADVRKQNIIPHLGPDGKSQVSVVYDGAKPKYVSAIVIAQQHTVKISEEDVRKAILEKVIKPVCRQYITPQTAIHINATGRFLIGGPAADTGLTGRKIIVDTYGGIGRHGGGAFSGKDPTKVDRSAAYMMRHIAKNVVARGYAKRCEVQVSYVIGVAQPVSFALDTFGTNTVPEEDIIAWVHANFPLKPKEIISYLKLQKPWYKKTAAYGHFGRDEFPWERIIAEPIDARDVDVRNVKKSTAKSTKKVSTKKIKIKRKV